MRKLILTGLAEETDLSSGVTFYLLVFNKGALRLPVNEDVVKQVLAIINTEEEGGHQEPRGADWNVQTPDPGYAPPRYDRGQLPPDHGAAQVPSSHELPPGTPIPRRSGDYGMPPAGPAPMAPVEDDDDDDGAPQF